MTYFLEKLLKKIGDIIFNYFPFLIGDVHILLDKDTSDLKSVETFSKLMSNFSQISCHLDLSDLMKHISTMDLEKKYGGNVDDIKEYWPPRCIGDATKTFDENSYANNQIIPFCIGSSEYIGYLSAMKKTSTSNNLTLSFSLSNP